VMDGGDGGRPPGGQAGVEVGAGAVALDDVGLPLLEEPAEALKGRGSPRGAIGTTSKGRFLRPRSSSRGPFSGRATAGLKERGSSASAICRRNRSPPAHRALPATWKILSGPFMGEV